MHISSPIRLYVCECILFLLQRFVKVRLKLSQQHVNMMQKSIIEISIVFLYRMAMYSSHEKLPHCFPYN